MDIVKRFLGNLLPLTLLALAVTVLIFMSNDGCGDRPQDFRATGITLGVGLLLAISTAPTTSSTTATARSTSPIRPTASNNRPTTPPKKSTTRASTVSPPMGPSPC